MRIFANNPGDIFILPTLAHTLSRIAFQVSHQDNDTNFPICWIQQSLSRSTLPKFACDQRSHRHPQTGSLRAILDCLTCQRFSQDSRVDSFIGKKPPTFREWQYNKLDIIDSQTTLFARTSDTRYSTIRGM